jgi:hypothetical protein
MPASFSLSSQTKLLSSKPGAIQIADSFAGLIDKSTSTAKSSKHTETHRKRKQADNSEKTNPKRKGTEKPRHVDGFAETKTVRATERPEIRFRIIIEWYLNVHADE